MTGPWIGIDPGSRRSGLVLRLGDQCLGSRTIVRAAEETEIGVGPIYWAEINESIAYLMAAAVKGGYGCPRRAIEGVRAPVGFRDGKKQFAKPVDLLGLGATFGAIYGQHPDCLIVAPGGNGSRMLASYPAALVTAAERRHGLMRRAPNGSLVSHARSGWDVAGAAALTVRLGAA